MIEVFQELNKFNHILFEEERHLYFAGEQKLTSCTTLLKEYKVAFDTDTRAEAFAKKHKMSKDDVIVLWEYTRDRSGHKGTEIHKYIELSIAGKSYTPYRGIYDDLNESYDIITTMFDKFWAQCKDVLIPIRSELVIGDVELGVGGMVDQLFWNTKHQEIQIWDWKTNKEIKHICPYGNRMLGPLSDLFDCEFASYSMQLAIYKRIIERNTNLKIGRCYLLHLCEFNDNFRVIETKDMGRYVDMLFDA